MSAVFSDPGFINRQLRNIRIADRTERMELLTTIMRGEQVGTQPHPRYPDLEVGVFPNLGQRIKALTTLGKMEGDFVVRVDVTNTINYVDELKRLKQLGSDQAAVGDAEFTEIEDTPTTSAGLTFL